MSFKKVKNLKMPNLWNLAIIFIFSLVLVVPPFFWGGKDVRVKFILLTFLFPLTYLVWKLRGKLEMKGISLPFIFLAIFILGMAISIFYSPEKYFAAETLFHFLSYFFLFLLIFNFLESKKQIDYFAYLVIGLGIILSLWGIYIFIYSESYLRLGSTFYSHIPFGEFLVYPIFLGLSLICFKPLKLSLKIPLVLINSLFFVTFFFAHSRGAWLSFLLIFVLLFLFFRKNILKKRVLISLAIIVLSSLIGIYGLYQLKSRQAEEFLEKAIYSHETIKENALTARLYFWKGGLEVFKDKPLFGWGLESYKSLHKKYLQPPFYYTTDPHNFYLKVLAEMGIIFFLVFLGFVFSLIYYSFQVLGKIKFNLETNAKPNKSDLFLLGMIGGVGSSLVHNFLNFGWSYPANLIIFFLFGGIILKAYSTWQKKETKNKKIGEKKSFSKNIKSGGYLPFFLLALILFFVGWMVFISDSYFQKGKILLGEGKEKEAVSSFQKALKFNSINPGYNRFVSSVYFSLAQKDINNKSEPLSKAKYFNKKTLKWANDSTDLISQGKIYSFEEEYGLAEESFKSAINKYPSSFNGYLYLTVLYFNQNRFSEIHSLLDKILPKYRKEYILSPLYMVPDKKIPLAKISFLHNINGVAYFNENKFEEAKTEFEKAISYFPQNDSAFKNLLILKEIEAQ